MQSNTTGHSMELFFLSLELFLLGYLIARNNLLSKKISSLQENQKILDEALCGDIEGVEKAIVGLSEKVDSLPNMVKDDIHRFLVEQRESLSTRPIKPNNWDSMKEAFKGPTRVEINERN